MRHRLDPYLPDSRYYFVPESPIYFEIGLISFIKTTRILSFKIYDEEGKYSNRYKTWFEKETGFKQ